jgi:ABC-type cobalt transport system substrate-binding protein
VLGASAVLVGAGVVMFVVGRVKGRHQAG